MAEPIPELEERAAGEAEDIEGTPLLLLWTPLLVPLTGMKLRFDSNDGILAVVVERRL